MLVASKTVKSKYLNNQLSLVGMEAPVAYYNNRHLLMSQFAQKQNYKTASLHSRTLQYHTNTTELTPQCMVTPEVPCYLSVLNVVIQLCNMNSVRSWLY